MENHFMQVDKQNDEFEKYCRFIRDNIIGELHPIKTPFGLRNMIYSDWTASGRSLRFIEDSLKEDVAPYYGNTHSIASNNARQSTWFIYEARESVRQFVGGNPEDAIIFTGQGSTGAVSKFLKMMDASYWISIIKKFKSGRITQSLFKDISVNVIQDRWKSFKCVSCETQYDTEAAFRRHYNKIHREKYQTKSDFTQNEEDIENYRITFMVDPSSHHSLFLPFIEYSKRYIKGLKALHHGLKYKLSFSLVYLNLNRRGEVDIPNLEDELIKSKNDNVFNIPFLLISAGSNVSGRLNDYSEISKISHRYGGITMVDFAATAPHVRPNMSPPLNPQGYVDVGVFSSHKLLGGPSTPGVLIIKRDLLLTEKPSDPGGNSVFFVSMDDHEYILNKEEREESGTSDILGISRLGMVMKLDMKIPQYLKQSKERLLFERVISEWNKFNVKNGPKIDILGFEELIVEKQELNKGQYLMSLPIISFLIKPLSFENEQVKLDFFSESSSKIVTISDNEGKGFYLHYNFVCSLLNDLFGIQSRGGCSCAGPYSQRLLGFDKEKTKQLYQDLVIRGIESVRPGFTRISLHWSDNLDTVDYIIKSVIWIASHGWKFLPLYIFEESLGTWRHKSEWKSLDKIHRRWLGNSIGQFYFDKFEQLSSQNSVNIESKLSKRELNFERNFEIANEILRNLEEIITNSKGCPGVAYEKEFKLDPALKDVIYQNNQHFNNSINSSDLSSINDFELLSESKLKWFITPKYIQNIIHTLRNNSNNNNNNISIPAELSTLNCMLANSDSFKCGATPDESNRQRQKQKQEEREELEKQNCKKNKILEGVGLFPKPNDFGVIRKQVGQAIKRFDMIKQGDKVLVAVSGGKDSLTMLHILLFLQKVAPVKFEVSAATVDPQTSEMDASKLIPYMESIGVKYHFISYPIVDIAAKVKQKQKKISYCAFCSRMKRGLLYSCMKKNGYNVLSLGQHVDDICESFFLSLMNNGKLNTMKANYFVSEYNIRVIRPMIYCREKDLAHFALKAQLPIIAENCPACFSQPKERRHVKQLLSQEESHNPTIYSSIINALYPLISINHTNSLVKEEEFIAKNDALKVVSKLDEDISSELLLTSCSR
ncbi:PP-loop family [Cryptosporidium sp. chipmunk genotype I]|uniref:PP-loop family n=1 Tax=Cryptosporidium sp. chipmunk genotype I TaxID=1280935 RepID=UPI00351A5B57|nr:PP-loop family [Cryptosporidium sp. chipmunk genotype I]